MNTPVNERYMKPIANLQEYVRNHMIRQRAGWINGKYLLDGREYTEDEFNQMFPAVLLYETVQLDGRRLKQ